jgi:TorA maturation chaperone TorD
MRIMIAGVGDRPPVSMTEQRNFFQKRLLPWIFDCCGAIEKSSLANYYRRVAEFTSLFMALERDSIGME